MQWLKRVHNPTSRSSRISNHLEKSGLLFDLEGILLIDNKHKDVTIMDSNTRI